MVSWNISTFNLWSWEFCLLLAVNLYDMWKVKGNAKNAQPLHISEEPTHKLQYNRNFCFSKVSFAHSMDEQKPLNSARQKCNVWNGLNSRYASVTALKDLELVLCLFSVYAGNKPKRVSPTAFFSPKMLGHKTNFTPIRWITLFLLRVSFCYTQHY